jgi:hypothetical protein
MPTIIYSGVSKHILKPQWIGVSLAWMSLMQPIGMMGRAETIRQPPPLLVLEDGYIKDHQVVR